jgi:hypothetical protein
MIEADVCNESPIHYEHVYSNSALPRRESFGSALKPCAFFAPQRFHPKIVPDGFGATFTGGRLSGNREGRGWWNFRVALHPCGEPLGAAFIVAKGAVGCISDSAHLILPHVAKFRDLFPGKKEIRMLHGDLEKLFLIELHGVFLSLDKGFSEIGNDPSQRDGVLRLDGFIWLRQGHKLNGRQKQAGETTIG